MSENQQLSWPGWEMVRLIGHGNFGAVYEIRRKLGEIEEKAALKVIRLPQSQHDIDEMYSNGYDEEDVTTAFQSHLDSIISEYSLMRKMNGHTNIVSCDDIRYVQHDDGIGWDIFIKMELLTPLTKALPAQIDEQTTVKIAKDICSALVLCKKSNIIHRDVKPQNIFMSEFGDYKLGDFGIAKTVEKTSGGTMAGTGPFMAPEVAHFQPYGHSADIYSLGIVLYWLLNERRLPFMPLPPEKPKISMELEAKERRLRGEPLPAPAHGSKALQAIVLKACAYDPAQRYHTAAEMLQDLEKLGAKPAMPELVSAVALGQQTAATPASEQKPAGFDPLISAAGAASEEETSTEYKPMVKAPESQPETSASVTKLEPATKLSSTAESYRQRYQQHYEKPQEPAQKTREQIAEEYRRNYQAQQEKQEKAGSAPAESQKKMKLWPVFVAAAIVVLLLIILLPKACSNRPQTPDVPQNNQQGEIPQHDPTEAPTDHAHTWIGLTSNKVQVAYYRGIAVEIQDATADAEFAARQQAENILTEWQTAGGTEEVFAELCNRYPNGLTTKDVACVINADNAKKTTAEYWLFDAGRASGDVGIIDVVNAYGVFYFVSGGTYTIDSDNPQYCSLCKETNGKLIPWVDEQEEENTENQISQQPTQGQQSTQQQTEPPKQPVTLSSILVQSMPNKTQYYYHERLDTTGLSIKLIYSDGTTTTVSNGFSCTPKRWEDFGDQKITVTYEGKQTNFTVNVKRDTILSATIYHQPNKTVFLRGEPFSTEGLMLETKLESGGTMLWDYYDYFDFYGSLPDMHQLGTHTVFVGIDGTTTGYNVADGAYVTYEINVSDDLFVYINGHTSYDVTLDRSNPSGVDANGNPYWKIPLPTCKTYSASGEEFSYEWQLISWETNGYNDPYVQGNSLIVRDKTLDSCYMVLRAVTYAYGYEYHSADVTYLVRFH